MSELTNIEWCDSTFNGWIGCTKISPGCDFCYAEREMANRLKIVQWGAHGDRVRTKPANWRKPLAWNAKHEQFYAEHGRRQRVFCSSLADVFDNGVDDEWRNDLANLIQETPHLDWLILTKRIGNAGAMLSSMFLDGVPDNVWLGATVVNQTEAERDIPKLLRTEARVRFLSVEPMLGPIDLTSVDIDGRSLICPLTKPASCDDINGRNTPDLPRIDWVIVGGESGPHARPMHPQWARELRDQCLAVGVAFLFKQWGEWTPGENVTVAKGTVDIAHWFADEWSFGRENLASFGGHVDDQPELYRVGKKAAGRRLDGQTHDGFPGT